MLCIEKNNKKNEKKKMKMLIRMNFKSKNIKNTNSQLPPYKILALYIHTHV